MWTSAVGLRWSVVVLRGRTHSRPRTYRICHIVRALKRKFHIRKNHKCVRRKINEEKRMQVGYTVGCIRVLSSLRVVPKTSFLYKTNLLIHEQ